MKERKKDWVLWKQKEKVKKCEIWHRPLILSLCHRGVQHILDKFMGKHPSYGFLILLLMKKPHSIFIPELFHTPSFIWCGKKKKTTNHSVGDFASAGHCTATFEDTSCAAESFNGHLVNSRWATMKEKGVVTEQKPWEREREKCTNTRAWLELIYCQSSYLSCRL